MVAAGHNVTQEGDDADALYLLQEGARLALFLRLQSSTGTVRGLVMHRCLDNIRDDASLPKYGGCFHAPNEVCK